LDKVTIIYTREHVMHYWFNTNPPITTKCVSQIISYNTYIFKHALKCV